MSKTSKTTQENMPPEWALPLLKKGAGEAMALYESGKGYNPYTGPTRAGFSDVSLGAMNSALKATGYTGAPVTNDSWQKNTAVLDAKKQLQDMIAKASQKPVAPANTGRSTPKMYQAPSGNSFPIPPHATVKDGEVWTTSGRGGSGKTFLGKVK